MNKKDKNLDGELLQTILLRCPITNEIQKIVSVVSKNKWVEIRTKGKSTAWKHKISSEEI